MSEIRATTISNAAGTGPATLTGQSAAKAWVNFNGTGTIAAQDSFNVSSLSDNGTGDYRINFSSAFAASVYAPSGSCNLAGLGYQANHYPLTSSQMVSRTINSSGTFVDNDTVTSNSHGDLA